MDMDALPRLELADPGPMRDLIVAAILDGTKTTTTGLALEYDRTGRRIPEAGHLLALVDSDGGTAAVVELTEVRRVRVADIDLRHVLDDGDGSIAEWRAAHQEYWDTEEMRDLLGDAEFSVDDDTEVLAQRFRLVHGTGPA